MFAGHDLGAADGKGKRGGPLGRLSLSFACLLADVHDSVAALDQCAGVAANAIALLIVIPAAVARVGAAPEPTGRAIPIPGRAADPTPGAASVVGPHCVPRETRLVGYVIIIGMVVRGDIEPPRLGTLD